MFRVWKILSTKYKWLSLLTVLMTIGQVIIFLLFPNLIAQLIAQVGAYAASEGHDVKITVDIIHVVYLQYDSPYQAITSVSIIFLVSLFVGMLLGVGASSLANVIAVNAAKNLRANLFYHVQRLNAKKINEISHSKLLTSFTSDIARIQEGSLTALRTMILGPIYFIGGLIFALMTNLKFSISMGVLVPLLLAVAVIVAIKGIPYFKKQQQGLDQINLESQENINGIKVIKSFNLEANQKQKFLKANDYWLGISIKGNLIQNIAIPVVTLIIQICTVIILGIAGSKSIRPDFQAAFLAGQEALEKEVQNYLNYLTSINAFVGYLWTVSNGLIMSIFVSVFFFRSQVSAKRIWAIMDLENDLKTNADNKKQIQGGNIIFKDVYFKYFNDSPEYVLQNLNFEIQNGQTIGIIGPTGSGKSSIAHVIAHDWDIIQGSIEIDNQNIQEYNQQNINKAISYVYQKPFLLSGTIKSNMLFANPEATEEEIEKALKIAGAHEFVYKFSDKLDHPISQGATNLSGGQRQRLFIAQALLKDPKILIFDDSTSALDNKTDKLVRTNIKKYFNNLTTIIISQKLSSIIECDKILVIEDGKITGFDSHENLLKTNKYYSEVAKSQLGDQ
ncbi:ABC transporter ATP-binding protein [[Mycoplasma] gypis]|uniref:ABC transporter ATP-binding protein n=1 Tax=[Mycoplasma] gypis TaxID=92404 RepID=A0ABZ2RW40_9BACT|nr:ABC transporter ATP-binding protein [[Mycoplasma] gypis]MBN0919330.1 ABC transporter ATP-binding protein [[Mycoplasma] gypis]